MQIQVHSQLQLTFPAGIVLGVYLHRGHVVAQFPTEHNHMPCKTVTVMYVSKTINIPMARGLCSYPGEYQYSPESSGDSGLLRVIP